MVDTRRQGLSLSATDIRNTTDWPESLIRDYLEAITDLRNLETSTNYLEQMQGWGLYQDDTYTSGAPFILAAGTVSALPNDAAIKLETYLPVGVSALYDGSNIRPAQEGDYYALTVRFNAVYRGDVPIVEWGVRDSSGDRFRQTVPFTTDPGITHPYLLLANFHATADLVADGGEVFVASVNGSDVEVYGIEYQVSRLYSEQV